MYPTARPFLCTGSPFGCSVFLVGIDPGVGIAFWPHWHPNKGCDKQGWLQSYLAKHNRYRPTRKRIEILLKMLAPHRVLETNIFPFQREPRTKLISTDTRLFEFLLQTIQPRLIFVHGQPAVQRLSELLQTRLPRGEFVRVKYQQRIVHVIAGHHLSGQGQTAGEAWSDVKVEEFGRRLRNHIAR